MIKRETLELSARKFGALTGVFRCSRCGDEWPVRRNNETELIAKELEHSAVGCNGSLYAVGDQELLESAMAVAGL